MNYCVSDSFDIDMPEEKINCISTLGLAHIGDSVYEVLVRTFLCVSGHLTVTELHRLTVSYVNAAFQAKAADKIYDTLTDAEKSIYKRGRNTKVNSVPKNGSISDYHKATGLETLFGYLYLQGNRKRLSELFAVIMETSDNGN